MTSLAVFDHQVGRGAFSIVAGHQVAAYRRPRRYLRASSRGRQPLLAVAFWIDCNPPRRGGSGLVRTDLRDPLTQISLGTFASPTRSRCRDRPVPRWSARMHRCEFGETCTSWAGNPRAQAGCERRQSPLHYICVTVLADFSGTHSQSWGRTGFDGDMKAVVARRVALTRKTGALRNLPADNNGYALAA